MLKYLVEWQFKWVFVCSEKKIKKVVMLSDRSDGSEVKFTVVLGVDVGDIKKGALMMKVRSPLIKERKKEREMNKRRESYLQDIKVRLSEGKTNSDQRRGISSLFLNPLGPHSKGTAQKARE